MLLHVHRRRFAGGAYNADAIGALGDVPVNQFAQSGVIHAAIGVHGGGQRDDAAGYLAKSVGGRGGHERCDIWKTRNRLILRASVVAKPVTPRSEVVSVR